MKIRITPSTENALSLLRRAGYTFQRTENGEISFIRALANSGYPRFHCYTKEEKLNLTISIHLDQKKETYGQGTRHHGEYADEGPLAEEVRRLVSLFGEQAKII